MIFSIKVLSLAIIVLFAVQAQCDKEDGQPARKHGNHSLTSDTNVTSNAQPARMYPNHNASQKYSSRIAGSRYASHRPVFGIRTFPLGKINPTDAIIKPRTTVSPSTEKVLDFRIARPEDNDIKAVQYELSEDDEEDGEDDDEDEDDDEKSLDEDDDLRKAFAGGGKQKKEADDDDEKTLAQQVAEGKYGLIQNELFANGSKRPGILSYKSNNEVPADTKENLGGLDKDEIWLAEDHILVLRGGNYQNKENETPGAPVWPPIDNYLAPKRQVKIPKNPEIPPPFPVQLSEDGPVQFVKGQNNPSFLPPILPPLPPFQQEPNKTIPLPFTVVPIPSAEGKNNSLPFPVPPHLLPPFLSNLPPGATFVAPPNPNNTEIDEDDPSIYYPPKYDFFYPLDNTTAVPPGPLVPGIILPPPPDFFSLLKPDAPSDSQNQTDDSINTITTNTFVGPKYLPSLRKPGRTRVPGSVHFIRPSPSNATTSNSIVDTEEPEKPAVTYVYPENSKHKSSTTPPHNSFRTNKVYANKYHQNGFNSPIYVPNNGNRPLYHPLPTTSPKPNHITLPPTTKSLPKQILIITTPETTKKHKQGDTTSAYPKKPVEVKYEYVAPEIHPLRSLLKPNVTVSYNGKYGHLPPPADYKPVAKPEMDVTIIHGHYVTQPPSTKGSKVPSTDVNSITVTPVPVVKKVRIQQMHSDKANANAPPSSPTKATLYFYEETSTTEEPARGHPNPQKPANDAAKIPMAIKPEDKPATPYYYTTHSTSKTPIRQFLEETFHSSNVLTRKPQIAHVNSAEIITHNGYSDVPVKMKHLNYGPPISSPRPVVKYHYVTDGNTVVIPTPKIEDVEIKNSGSNGLQTVHLDPIPPVRPVSAPAPIVVEPVKASEEHQAHPVPQIVTASPIEYNTADGPFIPSNYYATVRPEHVHFTSQEQTLVDDITKNYFTIFGQKINSPPTTTPLAPVKPTPVKTKPEHESGLSFISDDGRNYKIQQVHDTKSGSPSKSSSSFYTGEKAKTPVPTRPPSNFEKYLKELTGEDQRDYIVSGVFPIKVKKGKGFLPNGIPAHLLPQHPVIFENDAAVTRPKLQYQPNLSTTLRPLVGVGIKSAYLPQISSTVKPYDVYQQQQVHQQNIHFSPNLQNYIQEFTALSSPTTKRPVRVKKPSNEYLPKSPVPYQGQDARPKPISLANDYLVNYKSPRPEVEHNAELVNIPYDNIKIVESPDLSRNPNLPPYSAPKVPQIPFDIGKVFFQNFPRPDFFGPRVPSHSNNGGNAFVSYNLPGNGGHFFFLTPQQVIEKQIESDNLRARDKTYKRVNRSHERTNRKQSGDHEATPSSGYASSDYLRRRRKKP